MKFRGPGENMRIVIMMIRQTCSTIFDQHDDHRRQTSTSGYKLQEKQTLRNGLDIRYRVSQHLAHASIVLSASTARSATNAASTARSATNAASTARSATNAASTASFASTNA